MEGKPPPTITKVALVMQNKMEISLQRLYLSICLCDEHTSLLSIVQRANNFSQFAALTLLLALFAEEMTLTTWQNLLPFGLWL